MGKKGRGSKDLEAPRDKCKLLYFCFVVVGAGFLVPWTTYISAFDYFFFYYEIEFPTVSVAIPVMYLVFTFFFGALNVFLVSRLEMHGRITFGYVMFFLSLLIIPMLDVGLHNCAIPTRVGFAVTLLSVAIMASGSGVQQSSYYGLSSMLPRRYTQAIMAGESLAGVVESGTRILTKAALPSQRVGALVFFSLSLLFICICFVCHRFIKGHEVVFYYVEKCSKSKGEHDLRELSSSAETVFSKSREVPDQEPLLGNGYGNSAEENSLSLSSSRNGGGGVAKEQVMAVDLSVASKMVQGEKRKLVCEDVSDVDVKVCERNESTVVGASWQRMKSYLHRCWLVVKQIWPLMAAIFTCYYITLLLFPGILALVQNCTLGSWSPVLVVAIFNLTDFVAKWATLIRFRWHPKGLLACSMARVVLVPLVILCVSPSPSHPVLSHNTVVWASLFAVLLGLTNGYFGSLPLINLSPEVKREGDKELAGTIMTMTLLAGLLAGSISAYGITPLTNLHHFSNSTQVKCYSDATQQFTDCLT